MKKCEIDYCAIGKRVRRARDLADLTQAELAEAIGYSTSHLAGLETGASGSLPLIFSVAKHLQVSVDYLLGLPLNLGRDSTDRISQIMQMATPAQREVLEQSVVDLSANISNHPEAVER